MTYTRIAEEKVSMYNLYKFYYELCHKQVQKGQYVPEYYEWLQWYNPVPQQLQTPLIIYKELYWAVDREKPIKSEKNKDTVSNKKTREG